MTDLGLAEISSNDGGGRFVIALVTNDGPDEMQFSAQVSQGSFAGSVVIWTNAAGAPTVLFDEIDRMWRGWEGEKSWSCPTQELALTASSAARGNIDLKVTMRDRQSSSCLSVLLTVSGGDLQQFAATLRDVFAHR